MVPQRNAVISIVVAILVVLVAILWFTIGRGGGPAQPDTAASKHVENTDGRAPPSKNGKAAGVAHLSEGPDRPMSDTAQPGQPAAGR